MWETQRSRTRKNRFAGWVCSSLSTLPLPASISWEEKMRRTSNPDKNPHLHFRERIFWRNFVSSINFGGKNLSTRCATVRNFSCYKPRRLGTTGNVRRRVYSNVVDPDPVDPYLNGLLNPNSVLRIPINISQYWCFTAEVFYHFFLIATKWPGRIRN
jgi:hypothetical protein